MLTGARIREDLQGIDGLRWITTLRAPTIRKLIAAGSVTPSLFDERDLPMTNNSPILPSDSAHVYRPRPSVTSESLTGAPRLC